MLRRFFRLNKRLSDWLERRLPQARENLFERFEAAVGEHMNARSGLLVADVGGGRAFRSARFRRRESATRVIAIDISAEELALNHDVDETRVADATRGLPLADGEVDLLTSRAVIEHVTDVDAFVAGAARALKPGGYTIHIAPNRWSPFAIVNRLLPHGLSQRVLYFFQPHVVGDCGFVAYYHDCTPAALTAAFRRHGLEVVDCRLSYYQSRYYDFFFPFYAASALYELAVRAADVQSLCAYMMITARKPD